MDQTVEEWPASERQSAPVVVLISEGGVTEPRILQLLERSQMVVIVPSAEAARAVLHAAEASRPDDVADGPVSLDQLSIHPSEHRACWCDTELQLSEQELNVLTLLASEPARAFSFQELVCRL